MLKHPPEIRYGPPATRRRPARWEPEGRAGSRTACATNPLPVIVSCHQVVRSGGGVGGYLGGTDAKRGSLTLEAAAETRSPVWTATRSRTSSRRLTQLHGRAFIRPGLLVE